jgi:NADPH-dependent curcumin reductase CurA
VNSREIHLASRPTGWPTADNFRLVEVEVPEPGPGQVVVRNLVMSVDPAMRGRMNDVKSYVPPFQLDRALDGGASKAPSAFLGLLWGENTGKMLVEF